MEVCTVLLLSMGALVCYLLLLTDDLFPGGDNARYLALAKSLLLSSGYRNAGMVTRPPHTIAPPGFALSLMPVIGVFGMNVTATRSLVALSGSLAVAVVYGVCRRRYSRRHALQVAVLFAIAPVTFMYARRVYSDLPFTALSLATLPTVELYARERSRVNGRLLVAVGLASASFYMRPAALALALASVLWLLARREVAKGMLFGTGTGVLVVPWYLWTWAASGSAVSGHIGALLKLRSTGDPLLPVLANLAHYGVLLGENLWYLPTKGTIHLGLSGWPVTVVSACSVAGVISVVSLGLREQVREEARLSEYYVGIYVLGLLAYAFVIDRFVVPILPFVVDYYLRGVRVLSRWVAQRSGKCAPIAIGVRVTLVWLVLISGSAHIAARLYQEQRFAVFSPVAAAHYDVARWARSHLEPDAIVVTELRDHFFVYSGLQTWDPRTEDLGAVGAREVYGVTDGQLAGGPARWLGEAGYVMSPLPTYCSGQGGFCLYGARRLGSASYE